MIAAISFNVFGKCKILLYLVGSYSNIDWQSGHSTALGEEYIAYEYKESQKGQKALAIEKSFDGEYILRLFETKRYILKIVDNFAGVPLPKFQNEGNKFLKIDKDVDSVSFQFVNYLGRSRMSFVFLDESKRLLFEVVPDKMNYEDDYVSLTESIAQECAGLLMEYNGATSNLFSQTNDNQQSLLEQFIFLRQFCFSQNMRGLFEAIKRNPDCILVKEEDIEPLGRGIPSTKFYTNPFTYGKGWGCFGRSSKEGNVFLPQYVAVTKKHENLDTPANRFVKYALQKFDTICTELINVTEKEEGGKQSECCREAKAMKEMLDGICQDSFFEDINDLEIMPQNNQVLQKREGYAQIFAASSMVDLALQLDWKGNKEIYEGESKNVALLYEYWLFFELYKIICSIDGCKPVMTKEDPFLMENNGLTISLEQGKKSCQSFVIWEEQLKINLYYNRAFSKKEFQTTSYEESYSRPFRPDYTLAIFPSAYSKGKYNGEDEAIRDGAVSYIHFDAKYRITDLTAFMGENANNLDDEENFADEKMESVINTYKRGDLLKMHTYNDAIRRTIGSYVLYPGSGEKAEFKLYDEVLPGIGAFAIRPSIDASGENELKKFIVDLLSVKRAENSRLNRMKYYTEMILREPSASIYRKSSINNNKAEYPPKLKSYIMGYIRGDVPSDYYFHLKNSNLLEVGGEFWFYFYAIKGNNVYSHHKDIFKLVDFRFYKNNIGKTNSYILEPIICKVISNELISKEELVKRLNIQGYYTDKASHNADFYYILKVRVYDIQEVSLELAVSEVNSENGNDTFSPHSPKIIVC